MKLHDMKRPIKVSVVMPVYNEAESVEAIIERVLHHENPRIYELIIIDDGSSDDSAARICAYKSQDSRIKFFKQPLNKGKGAAIRYGFSQVSGDIIIIQDADLEYDPAEYTALLTPIYEDRADVVYGSRFLGSKEHRVLFFWHSIGNRFLTFISNVFTNLNLTDMETCYKVFRADIIREIALCENRFGIEVELVAKIARQQVRIYEVGIAYHGRTYDQGKKIGWKDGVEALYCILKYNIWRRK